VNEETCVRRTGMLSREQANQISQDLAQDFREYERSFLLRLKWKCNFIRQLIILLQRKIQFTISGKSGFSGYR